MVSFLKRWLPEVDNHQVRWYYLTSILLDIWFVEAIWYFYWGKFGNYQAVGTVLAILTIVWVILEIPTGLFADKFGRRKSTVLGVGIMAGGAIIMAGGQNMAWLVVGGFLENVGRAFVSGAMEALVYEDIKVKYKGKADDIYGRVVAARLRWQILGYGLSVAVGGFLFEIYFRLAHIFQAIAIGTAFWASSHLKEAGVRLRKDEKVDYVAGFRQLLSKKMSLYVVPLLVAGILIYIYDWGLSKPNIALKFGLGYQAQGILFGLMGVADAMLLGQFSKWRKKVGDYRSIYLINMLVAGGFWAAGWVTGYLGLTILLMMELVTAWGAAVGSVITNKYIGSKYRATVLSTVEFVSKIPFVLTAPLAGRLIDLGKIDSFHRGIGGLGIMVGVVAYLVLKDDRASKGKTAFAKAVAGRYNMNSRKCP